MLFFIQGAGLIMVTKEQVVEALEGIVDPFLHKTLKETGAIKEVTVKPEKEHVSVKIQS